MCSPVEFLRRLSVTLVWSVTCSAAYAFDWSDTSVGTRFGTQFKEPYVANGAAISKGIISFEHADAYRFGSNFLNLDLLQSDHVDNHALEAYLVYRHTLDFSKISGKKVNVPGVRDVGLTLGFDCNSKNDPGYASKKRMLVVGPTVKLDVPGFLNVSLLILNESNTPKGVSERYTYKAHPDLNLAWGIPLGSTRLSFEGYGDIIASKGRNEFGGSTAPEIHIDAKLMYGIDVKRTFRVGLGYEYWRNKFGNPSSVPGSLASTPMIRVEYHF